MNVQKEQMTALMFAVKVGSFDVVQMLVENNANIFAMDSVSFSYSKGSAKLVQ